MSNRDVFRIGGWSALLAALISVAAAVSITVAPDNVTLQAMLTVVGVLILTPVFYALFVAHRAEAAGLSLAGLVLWVVALVPNVVGSIDPKIISLPSAGMAFVPPFLVFGFLAWRNVSWPNGLAGLLVSAGILFGIAGIVSYSRTTDLGNAIAAIGAILLLVWSLWIWRIFTSEKPAFA
jgi:hypothetical protein